MSLFPLLLQPAELAGRLNEPRLLILDVGKEAIYQQAHLPGAIFLDYRRLQKGVPPAPGLLPEAEAIAQLFSDIGLQADTHVVAYDDEGGTRAARLLWLLDAAGHQHYSWLNGGIHAWLDEDLPIETEAVYAIPSQVTAAQLDLKPQVDLEYLLAHYQDENLVIWDARMAEEFAGSRVMAARGGHIPGAVNYDWSLLIDPARNNRLLPLETIQQQLSALGIDSSKTVITHCQTHHRSSFSWLAGKILGFKQIFGYPGAWSEWGNNPDTPVAVGND